VRNPNIPVIALTAHALATDRIRCLAAGMNDYLTKPINPIALQQALSRLLPAAAARPDNPAAEPRGLFDEAALLARTDNDRAFARELIELFVRSAGATLTQLDDAVGDRAEPETTRKLAHSLKGSAATAAAAALAAGAADLERVAGSPREAAALSSLHATFALTMAEWARLNWIARGSAEVLSLPAAGGERV
jgi:DNA-binding response OmpR family regulator